MTLNFVVPEVLGGGGDSPFQFFRKGFNIGGMESSPSWRDVVISGNTALTLVNAKANGLNYLKLFGGTEQRGDVPKGYTELQWVETDGNQYIDLGLKTTLDTVLETEVALTDKNTNQMLWAMSSGSGKQITCYFSGGGNSRFGDQLISATFRTYMTSGVFAKVKQDKTGIYIDEQSYTYTVTNDFTSENAMYYLWANGSSANKIVGKAKALTVTQGGNKYIFRPCKRNSDNLVRFYCKETNTFYDNLGTGSFVAGDTATPSPSYPIDIIANNGVIKVKDDELPVGYKRLLNIESSGAQIIDTNYVLQETDSVEVDYNITNRSRSGNKFILGCRPILDNPNIGMWVETYGSQNTWYVRFGSPNSVNVASTTSQLSGTLKVSKGSFVVNGVKILQPEFTGMSPNQMSIFNRRSSDGSVPTAGCSARISAVRILNGNDIIRKYIPCESPDNILGLYEVIQGEFLTNNGSGDFTAGSYDTSHLTEIYYDGTVETVATKQAYVSDSDIVNGTGLNSSNGATISNANRCYVLFPCKAGVTYTAQTDTADLIGGNFIEYRQPSAISTNFIKSITATDDGLVGGVYQFHAVCDTDGWAGWQCKSNKDTALANNWQITSDISTATAQPLLKVGTYQDVQSVLDGVVTRNVRAKVLNGSENWIYTVSLLNYMYSLRIDDLYAEDASVTSKRKTPYCTHFVRSEQWVTSSAGARNNVVQAWKPSSGSSVLGLGYNYPSAGGLADFKAWLAEQYNAGTPVIVVYPTQTATTESVTGQPLTIQAGTNIVEITQASIDNLELEVSYKAGVEVTVEEVENAQLDDDVTVIIS